MNVLFITEYQLYESKGGVERITSILMEHFKKNKINTYNAFLKHHYPLNNLSSSEFYISKIDISIFKEIIEKNSITVVINQAGFNYKIISVIKNLNINIISCLHSSPDFRITYNDILLTNNLDFDNHISTNLKLFFKPIYFYFLWIREKLHLRYVYKYSDKLVLLSSTFTSNFLKITNLKSSKKILIIPNPNNPKFNYEIKNLKNKRKTVLYVGRLQSGKRVDLILDIWKTISIEFPEWDLKIIGNGQDFNKINNFVTENKLQNVTIFGHSDEIDKFYEEASIFISLSAFEGFPTVLSEAASFGLVPIVYNTYSSVTDLIQHGKTGIIINDKEKDDLILNLKKLMSNNDYRNKLALNNFNFIKKFNVDHIYQFWSKLLFSS